MEFGNLSNKKIYCSPLFNDCIVKQKSGMQINSNNAQADSVCIGETYEEQVKNLLSELDKTKKQDGLIGDIWDGFKNFTRIGAGSSKVQQAILKFQNGEIDLKTAQETLQNFQEGQKVCLDVFADMLSSIVAVGAFAACVPTGGTSLVLGLSISTVLSGGIKAGVKAIDSKMNKREYDSKNLAYDVLTGAVNGLFAPITNGLGSSLTKTIGCKLGLEITGDVLEAGAKTTLKSLIVNQSIDVVGGTLKKRALAVGAGMALDGAVGGAADNTVRAALEGQDKKGIIKSALEGFVGGLIMSPVIGGSMRLLGKIGKEFGDKIFKKAPKSPEPIVPNHENPDITIKADSPDVTVETPKKPVKTSNSSVDSPKTSSRGISLEAVAKIRKSFSEIPATFDEKVVFIKNIYKTDLSTGKEITHPGQLSSILNNPGIQELAQLPNDDLVFILEHLLKLSESFDSKRFIFDRPIDVDSVKTLQQRNIYQIIKDKMSGDPKGRIFVCNFKRIASMSDDEFERLSLLLPAIGNRPDVSLDGLVRFAKKTNKDTIEYMIQNNLFDFDNFPRLLTTCEFFAEFEGCHISTVERIHKRNLLSILQDRKYLDFPQSLKQVLAFATLFTDDEWSIVEKRGLFSMHTPAGIYLSPYDIQKLYKAPAKLFDRINSRDILSNLKTNVDNIIRLIELDDASWDRICAIGLDIDDYFFKKQQNIADILALSDSQIQIAKSRGIMLNYPEEYQLIDFPDEQWQRLVDRGYTRKSQNDFCMYHAESMTRLSLLTDSEFEVAQKRNLVPKKGAISTYEFNEKAFILAKMSDFEFENYIKRGLAKEKMSVEDILYVCQLTDEQFKEFQERILPLISSGLNNRFLNSDKKFNAFTYSKLFKLSSEKFEMALDFLSISDYEDSFYFSQFSPDELLEIVEFEPEKIQLLRNILCRKEGFSAAGRLQKETLLKIFSFDLKDIQKIINLFGILQIDQVDFLFNQGVILDIVNNGIVEKNMQLLKKINSSYMGNGAKLELVQRLLGLKKTDYSKLSLRDKLNKLSILQEAQTSSIFSDEESNFLNLEKDIIKLQKAISRIIETDDVPRASIANMFKNFFANNNPELDELLSTFDFGQFATEGLPLRYSRQQFISDLNIALKGLDEEQKAQILSKISISVNYNQNGDIIGYDGIINLKDLAQDGQEGLILSILTRFIRENSIETSNQELNTALNSLIRGMPEFINIIGKQQHSTHSFSLDIHILSVLKEVMANPEYKKLSDTDKFCAKLAAIMHDISKLEGVVDDNHAELCALYARDILNRENLNLPSDLKNRVYELIKNHHWLAKYNQGILSEQEAAIIFRRANDLKVAQILAEADLKSVTADGSFYQRYGNALSEASQTPIVNAHHEINKAGHMFLTNKIINMSKIPTIEHNGRTYKVLNLVQMEPNADLFQFGFEPGATAENLRLMIHMVSSGRISNLENALHLSDPSAQGFLCASYVSLKDHFTYGGYEFGVSLEGENVNWANAHSNNQGSGRGKNFIDFIEILSDPHDNYRTLVPDGIKLALGLTSQEYAQLYTIIQKYKYISQLDAVEKIVIGEKTFTGSEIKTAILNAGENMILNAQYLHNEANIFNPRINAVVAKVNSFDDIPQKLLDFAHNHSLPILLLGRD